VPWHNFHSSLVPSIVLGQEALDSCIRRDNIPFVQEGLGTDIANYNSQDMVVAVVVAAAAAADSKVFGWFVAG